MTGHRVRIIWFRFASAGAIVVLGMSAADRVGSAVVAAELLFVVALLLALALAFIQLPREVRQGIVARRRLVGVAIKSTLTASVLAPVFWVLSTVPMPGSVPFRPGAFAVLRTLDFVPSAFALLLPGEWRSGFHQYFRGTTYCFPGPFWWETTRYLRTAVPAYAILFFALSFVVKVLGAHGHGRRAA